MVLRPSLYGANGAPFGINCVCRSELMIAILSVWCHCQWKMSRLYHRCHHVMCTICNACAPCWQTDCYSHKADPMANSRLNLKTVILHGEDS
jgi:hypothetical protein